MTYYKERPIEKVREQRSKIPFFAPIKDEKSDREREKILKSLIGDENKF